MVKFLKLHVANNVLIVRSTILRPQISLEPRNKAVRGNGAVYPAKHTNTGEADKSAIK